MEEKTVLTLRLLLEEIKKDLPPFKIGLIFETMKSIYPSAAVKRSDKNILVEGIEITKPLAVSKKAKELFKKDKSVLADFYINFKKGDYLKIINVIDGSAICENISIKKEYKERYYNKQFVILTSEDIINGNVKQVKRGTKKLIEGLENIV